MNAFQGAMGLGTIDDLLISLDFQERVYGPESLPHVLVLGISPQFMANLPEDRPFMTGINLYSRFFRVEQTSSGPQLMPKTSWEGWRGRLRFLLLKQQARYLAAITGVLRHFLINEPGQLYFHPQHRSSESPILRQLGTLMKITSSTALGRYLNDYPSPYRYHHLEPMPVETLRQLLRMPDSWWTRIHAWNPETSSEVFTARFKRLRALTTDRGKLLYVVNLPEHEESRKLYRSEYYQSYLNLIRRVVEDTPFLDLREALTKEEFYDAVHVKRSGAAQVTDMVIGLMRNLDGPALSSARSMSLPKTGL
jgi:hypothetical protein